MLETPPVQRNPLPPHFPLWRGLSPMECGVCLSVSDSRLFWNRRRYESGPNEASRSACAREVEGGGGGVGAFTYSRNAIQAFRSPEKMKRVGRGAGRSGIKFLRGHCVAARPPPDLNQTKVALLLRPLSSSHLGFEPRLGFFATGSS